MQFPRIETPRLADMQAKQGAVVARFLTFAQRKSSLVIELYNSAFYKQKPTWDKIANFVYGDLCPNSEIRREVIDVQFHPVKMLIFVKFSSDNWRDKVVEKLQSNEGVIWKEYGVKIKGYSLDAEVKHFRLLGVSPETTADDIKKSFLDVGIGEVMEIKKGLLDERRMPGVSNGTWSLRVKITDPEKFIPSYIHRRDEGELWSLNFEGRVFCCWKCGSGSHIGDKCRDQMKTFEEVFNSSNPDFIKPTWATVVRSGQGVTDLQDQRNKEMESRLKEYNKRHRSKDSHGASAVQKEQQFDNKVHHSVGADQGLESSVTDTVILDTIDGRVQQLTEPMPETQVVKDNAPPGATCLEEGNQELKTSDISLVFGPGASTLAQELSPKVSDKETPLSETNLSNIDSSTPLRKRSRGRRRIRNSGRSSQSSPSPVRPPLQKQKLDEVDQQCIIDNRDQGQQDDLLDPGDKKLESEAAVGKEPGNLSDSGDWGDTSIEEGGMQASGDNLGERMESSEGTVGQRGSNSAQKEAEYEPPDRNASSTANPVDPKDP